MPFLTVRVIVPSPFTVCFSVCVCVCYNIYLTLFIHCSLEQNFLHYNDFDFVHHSILKISPRIKICCMNDLSYRLVRGIFAYDSSGRYGCNKFPETPFIEYPWPLPWEGRRLLSESTRENSNLITAFSWLSDGLFSQPGLFMWKQQTGLTMWLHWGIHELFEYLQKIYLRGKLDRCNPRLCL